MKVTGIIAEYNPFHNGHLYQLQKAKSDAGADYLVIVMSGDFVQRGTPAIIDKYTRAQMALKSGADLVLEMPVLWATASAEYFAAAGISILDKLGVTDTVSFGVESAQPELLTQIASVLIQEPESYRIQLNRALKQGNSFPVARKNALLDSGVLSGISADITLISQILDTPNNILGIEYLKSLQQRSSAIQPLPILRQGGGYHDSTIQPLASASAIRRSLQNDAALQEIKTAMPNSALALLDTYADKLPFLYENHFSSILKYKLLTESQNGYDTYADCSLDLSNRITNILNKYISYSEFCDLLKSKEVTHTRISRLLLHILLGIQKEDYLRGRSIDYTPYLRVLGFRKDAAPLLSEIKKHSSVPMITKVADAKDILCPDASSDSFAWLMFEKDIFAADIYTSVLTDLTGRTMRNEYTHGIVIV
jgi:predicted nucleotidyltransferase